MPKFTMLITRPEYDYPTAYFSLWSKNILTFAKQENIKYIDLHKERAIRKNVESYLSAHNPPLVVFNGHGSETVICGHKDDNLIVLGENEDILDSKIVYTIACSSAKALGLSCVEKGTKTFIGYLDEFSFYSNTSSQAKPLRDETAKPCFDSSNSLVISLLKGKPVKEAVQDSLELYRSWIRIYLHKTDIEAPFVLRSLIWNQSHLTVIGDHEAIVQ